MPIRSGRWSALALCLFFLFRSQLPSAQAIVLASVDGATNTLEPKTGFPLDHIGIVNQGASGIYLGEYDGKSWVLTANHIGPGSFELAGQIYSPVTGSTHQLMNPDATPSDILLFQINGGPRLSRLNLVSTNPIKGAQVFLIGFGQSGQPNRSYWVDNGGPWVPTVAGDPAANRIGYQWTGVQPGPKRWGVGSIAGTTYGVSQTRAFFTKFQDQTDDACGTGGDSGGAVFIHQGNQWQLIGMVDALAGLPNQPAGTSVFNSNVNIIADLSQYRSQIDAILLPNRNHHP